MLGSTSLWTSTQRNTSAPATRFASLPVGFLIGQSNYSSLLLMKREIKCFPQLTHTVFTGHIEFSWKTCSPKIILRGPSYRMRSCQHCIVPSAGPTHRTCCLRTDGPLCLRLCFLVEQVECQMWRWASGHAGIPTDTWTQLISFWLVLSLYSPNVYIRGSPQPLLLTPWQRPPGWLWLEQKAETILRMGEREVV